MQRFPLAGRRLIVSLSVCLTGLTIPLALAQSRPGAAAAENADVRQRVLAKVEALSKAIAEQIEAQRTVERAESTFRIYEDVNNGGKGLETLFPKLAEQKYQLQQIEIETAIMRDAGSASPRYQSLAKRVEEMKAAYTRQVDIAQRKVSQQLGDARREVEAASAQLKGAKGRVDALKNELAEFASRGADEKR